MRETLLPRLYHRNSYLINAASKLLGSGLITSVGFVLLSSNRIHSIDSGIMVRLLIFLQIHTIGLTITKLGFDSMAFAAYLDKPNLKANINNFIVKKCLPLSLIVFTITLYKFSLLIATITVVNTLVDQYSSSVISQLGFRHKFNITFFLNFISYPLYFIVVILFSFFLRLELNDYVVLFFVIMSLKFCFSFYFYSKVQCEGHIEINPKWIMGVQQILNYLLFKVDLVILTMPLVASTFLAITEKETIQILFLSRFPDLISGVTISLSVLFYPNFYFTNRFEFIKVVKKKYVVLYFFFLLFLMLLYLNLWRNSFALSIYNIIFYFIVGFLVVFSNLITFNLIRDENYKILIKNLIKSVSLGGIYAIICYIFNFNFLFLVVALQLLLFIFYFMKGDTGE